MSVRRRTTPPTSTASTTTMAAPEELFAPKRLKNTPTPTFTPLRTRRMTPKVSVRSPEELVSIRTTPPYVLSTSTTTKPFTSFTSAGATSKTTPLTTRIFTPPFEMPTSPSTTFEIPVTESSTTTMTTPLTTQIFTPPFEVPTTPSTTFETPVTESSTSNLLTTPKQETSEPLKLETSGEPTSQTKSTSTSEAMSSSSIMSSESSSFVSHALSTETNLNSTPLESSESFTASISGTGKLLTDVTKAYNSTEEAEFNTTTLEDFQVSNKFTEITSLDKSSTEVTIAKVSEIATASSKDQYVSTFDWLDVTDFSANRSSTYSDAVATSSRNITQTAQILITSPMWLYSLVFILIFISLLFLTLLLTVLWRAYLRHYWSAFVNRYCCVECCPRNTRIKPVGSSNQVLQGFPHYLIDPLAVGHPNWIVQRTPDNQSLITVSNGRPITVRDSEGEKLLETSNPQYRTVIKIPGSITYQQHNRDGTVAKVFGTPPNVNSVSNFSGQQANAMISRPVSFNNIGFQNDNTGTGRDNTFPMPYYPFANYPANIFFTGNPGYLMNDNYPYNPRYLSAGRTPSVPGQSVQKRAISGRKGKRLYPSLFSPVPMERPPTYSAIINASEIGITPNSIDVPDSQRKGRRERGIFSRIFGKTAANRPSNFDIQEESLLVGEDAPDHSRLINRNNNNHTSNYNNIISNNNNLRFMAASNDPRSLVLLNENVSTDKGMNTRETSRRKIITSEAMTEFRSNDEARTDSNGKDSARETNGMNFAITREANERNPQQAIVVVDRSNPSQITAIAEKPTKHSAHENGHGNNNSNNNNNNTDFEIKESNARNTQQSIIILDRSNPQVATTIKEPVKPFDLVNGVNNNNDSKGRDYGNKKSVPLLAWDNELMEEAEKSQPIAQSISAVTTSKEIVQTSKPTQMETIKDHRAVVIIQ